VLQTKIKDLRGEGWKNIHGRAELNAEIIRLHGLLKSQGNEHQIALNRVSELEAHLAANTARGRED